MWDYGGREGLSKKCRKCRKLADGTAEGRNGSRSLIGGCLLLCIRAERFGIDCPLDALSSGRT